MLVEISPRLVAQHYDDIDHLLSQRHIARDLAAHRIGYFAERGKLTRRQIKQFVARGYWGQYTSADLRSLERRVNESFFFQVTGETHGPLWGTDVYTTDSSPAKAAVHAGVLRDGEPFMTIGSPGADRQPQAMAQVLSKMLIWGMNPQQAVEHARFASYSFPQGAFPHQYEPRKLRIEADVPEEAVTQLRAYGHDIDRWPRWSWSAGGVCVAMRDPERRAFLGGADPRREGYVVAV